MIAKYNGTMFAYIANRRKREIITRLREKTDSGFQYDKSVYYKNVSEDELTDIFDVEFWVGYNAGLPNTPSMWEIDGEAGGIVNGKILLRFAEGLLPGWDVEEKNVCKKYVPITDLSHAKIIYIYRKKDGKVLSTIQKDESEVSIDKMLELCENYKKSNL